MLDGSWFPILAHEGESMSVGELLISVGLLVLCMGLIAGMMMLVLMKRFRRRQRMRREGVLAPSSKAADYVLAGLVAAAFLVVVWKFAWAAYYDIHYQRYEEKLEASGKHPKHGAEYKWERWHINGRYSGDSLILLVDDILEKAEPKQKIAASARVTSPTPTDWQPMTWDDKQKAFVGQFKPDGQKMEFEFRFKSGWSSFEEKLIGYVPADPMKGHKDLEVTQ